MSKLNPFREEILVAYRNGENMYVLAKHYGVSPWGIYKQVNRWTIMQDVDMRQVSLGKKRLEGY